MQIRMISSVEALGRDVWRQLEPADFPFFDYDFLAALAASESIGAEAGWLPLYLVASDSAGIAGVLCAYAKGHSHGEYIFDWQWARMYQQCGEPYYPKLLTAVPFTPATGPRLLLRGGAGQAAKEALIQAALGIARQAELSSYHALFLTPDDAAVFKDAGFLIRHSFQYHWHNAGYRDFQDYLDRMVGKRRRDTQRERRRAQSHGLRIDCLSGAELTSDHAVAMERLYLSTIDKKSAFAYLQPGFFAQLFAAMPGRLLLVTASAGRDIVAASFNVFKGQALFGRYWGCDHHYQDLHFELCYYQTIEFAIKHGLQLFEAGAQGEHKIQRGFLPALTLSAHQLFAASMRAHVAKYIVAEKTAVAEAMSELAKQNPFKPEPEAPG